MKIKFQDCLELNLIWYRNFENSLFKTKFLSKEFFLFEKNKKIDYTAFGEELLNLASNTKEKIYKTIEVSNNIETKAR